LDPCLLSRREFLNTLGEESNLKDYVFCCDCNVLHTPLDVRPGNHLNLKTRKCYHKLKDIESNLPLGTSPVNRTLDPNAITYFNPHEHLELFLTDETPHPSFKRKLDEFWNYVHLSRNPPALGDLRGIRAYIANEFCSSSIRMAMKMHPDGLDAH